MNKRDAIIVAVLVNLGLLIILVVGALSSKKSTKEDVVLQTENQAQIEEKALPGEAVVQVTPMNSQEEVAFDSLEEGELSHKLPSLEDQKEGEVAVLEPEYREVVVKKGDSLDRIARANHTSITKIRQINNLSKNVLRIGQVLKIESSGKVASNEESSQPSYYTVKVGDNPWTIAMKHHIKTRELLKLNNLTEAKARKLKAGDKLRVR